MRYKFVTECVHFIALGAWPTVSYGPQSIHVPHMYAAAMRYRRTVHLLRLGILGGPDKLDKVQMHRVCAPPMSRLSNLGMRVRGRCGVYIHDMPCTYHYRTGLHSPKQVICVLMHIHICSTKTTFIIRGQNQSITMRAEQERSGRNVKEVAQSTRCSERGVNRKDHITSRSVPALHNIASRKLDPSIHTDKSHPNVVRTLIIFDIFTISIDVDSYLFVE